MAPASEANKPKQQQQATNDNSGGGNSRPRVLGSGQQSQFAGASMMAMSVPQVSAPSRQPRPARPQLRRPIIVGAPGTDMRAQPPLQLAGVPPPKRPAHLPATYVRGHHPQLVATGLGGVGSPVASSQPGGKPNRYAWAQLHQAHHPAAAAAAAGGHHGGFHHHFAAPFSAASRGIMVVNPMQIVNLGAHTKSRLIKCIEAVKRFSEKWFSHVLLLLFLAIYACFGAYIFISFEASTEAYEKQLIADARGRILNETWDAAKNQGRDEFRVDYEKRFRNYEDLLKRACASGMNSNSQENQWNFWGALFYSMTVFTTIGYGHLTPITFGGRLATMIYAIFGIPILLMVLADLGKLLTRIIKYAFKKFRFLFNKLLGRKTTIRTRKLITDNTNQYIGVARDAFERGFAYIQPHNHYGQAPAAGYDPSGGPSLSVNAADGADGAAAADGRTKAKGSFASRFFTSKRDAGAEEATDADKKGQLQKTDVIVTPAKQTRPVSPKVDEKRSLVDHHRAGSSRRAQSPGQSSQAKRKISSSSQRAKAGAAAAKSSVSRSSSSSIVATTSSSLAELKATSKPKGSDDVEAPKAEQEEMSSGELEESATMVDEGYEDDDDIVDEFDIPVSFALFLLVTYMMFGAVIFSIWEGWNFFDALYFVFISMSTIGFGDLVPQHPKRMIGTFIYLLFGLALTSMCINVVQEKIHATFLRAKMQIGEKMGLDLEQIMADDYYDGSMYDDDDDNSEAGKSSSQANSTSVAAAAGGTNDNNADGDHHQGKHPNRPNHDPGKSVIASCENTTTNATTRCDNTRAAAAASPAPNKPRGKEGLMSGGGARRRAATGLPGHNNNSGSSFKRKSSRNKATMGRGQSAPAHHKQPQRQQLHLAALKTAAAAALLPATAALTASNAITPAVASAAATAAASQSPPAAAATSPPSSPTTNVPPDTTDQNSISSSFINASPIRLQQEPLRPEIEVLKRVEKFRSVSQPPGLVHQTVGIRSVCEPLTTPLRRFNASAAHFFEKHHPARLRATISGSPQISWRPVPKPLSSEPRRGQPRRPATGQNRHNNGYNDENRHHQHNDKHHHGSSGSPSSLTGPRATATRASGPSRRSSVSHELSELDDLIIALASRSPSERYGPLLGIPNSSGRSTRSNSPSNSLARRATCMTNHRPTNNTQAAAQAVKTTNSKSSGNYSSVDSNWANTTSDDLSDLSSRAKRSPSPSNLKDLDIKFARAGVIP